MTQINWRECPHSKENEVSLEWYFIGFYLTYVHVHCPCTEERYISLFRLLQRQLLKYLTIFIKSVWRNLLQNPQLMHFLLNLFTIQFSHYLGQNSLAEVLILWCIFWNLWKLRDWYVLVGLLHYQYIYREL